MAIQVHVTRDFGHPWTREKGWDLMEVKADTEADMDKMIAKAESKFWNTWIRDNTGNISAVLYKPAGIMRKWTCRSADRSMCSVEIVFE